MPTLYIRLTILVKHIQQVSLDQNQRYSSCCLPLKLQGTMCLTFMSTANQQTAPPKTNSTISMQLPYPSQITGYNAIIISTANQ